MTTNSQLVHGRERLAWSFLLGGFALFVAAAILAPLGMRAFLQNATRPLDMAVGASQGTVSIDNEQGVRRAVLPGEAAQPAQSGSVILADATAAGLVLVSPPEESQLLARFHLYSNTALQLERAVTPRFTLSERPREVDVTLTNGRLRLIVPEFEERPLRASVHTPHGQIQVDKPGQYAFHVINEETQVTVQEGQAVLLGEGDPMLLVAAERAVLRLEGAPVGPLPPQRNLIQNGDFRQRWEHWVRLAWNVEHADQPDGTLDIVQTAGQAGLRASRAGQGHADVGIRQVINQDVTDYETLLFEIDLRILEQTLGVCGTVGSECPVMVFIEYEDVNGNAQVWHQGFFAAGQIGQQGTPDVCMSCSPPRLEHYQVPPGQFAFYRADLIAELQRKGIPPPRRIKSIRLIASGHGFTVEVLNVGLIVE